MKKNKPVIAAFDFDGTITKRDSLIYFLMHISNSFIVAGKLLQLTPKFVAYLSKSLSRQEIKEEILSTFLKGLNSDQLAKLGESFAKSSLLKRLILKSAIQRLEWHQEQNHQCILISAGIGVYIEPWAKEIGFDHVICSKLEVATQNIITGKLEGQNCWGKEKVRRLEEVIGKPKDYILYAYGDSEGDLELLTFADYPFFCSFKRTTLYN